MASHCVWLLSSSASTVLSWPTFSLCLYCSTAPQPHHVFAPTGFTIHIATLIWHAQWSVQLCMHCFTPLSFELCCHFSYLYDCTLWIGYGRLTEGCDLVWKALQSLFGYVYGICFTRAAQENNWICSVLESHVSFHTCMASIRIHLEMPSKCQNHSPVIFLKGKKHI